MYTVVRKRAKIRNRYNQDTNGKVTHSQLDVTNESQEVSPFPAGDHNASMNRRARKHNKHKNKGWVLIYIFKNIIYTNRMNRNNQTKDGC